jgi:mono/diheme cytochrome c family protein
MIEMISRAVPAALIGWLLVGCAKSEQAEVATIADTVRPVAAAAVASAPLAASSSDSASTAVVDSTPAAATVAIPKAPSSAAKGAAPSGPSTRVGVYTDEQANRGKQVYAGSCRSCHSPTSHTGQVFQDWWQNKRLSELYNFIANQMPKNDPGTLAPEDVADVVAYLLKMNEMPTGRSELYPDADSLKKFWIDARAGR